MAASRLQKSEARTVASALNHQKEEGRTFLMTFTKDYPHLVPSVERFAKSLMKVSQNPDLGDESDSFGRGTTYISQINKRWLADALGAECEGELLPQVLDSLARRGGDDVARMFVIQTGLPHIKARISDHFSRDKAEFRTQVEAKSVQYGNILSKMKIWDFYVLDESGEECTAVDWVNGGWFRLTPPVPANTAKKDHVFKNLTHVLGASLEISRITKETVTGEWEVRNNWAENDATLTDPSDCMKFVCTQWFKKMKVDLLQGRPKQQAQTLIQRARAVVADSPAASSKRSTSPTSSQATTTSWGRKSTAASLSSLAPRTPAKKRSRISGKCSAQSSSPEAPPGDGAFVPGEPEEPEPSLPPAIEE